MSPQCYELQPKVVDEVNEKGGVSFHVKKRAPGKTRGIGRSIYGVFPEARVLQQDIPDERRVITKISWTQPPRFCTKPIEPLKTGSHHPAGCLRHPARVKVKGGAHADHHFRVQLSMK